MNHLPRRAALAWIGGFVGLSTAFVFLYPDSHQRDGGFHFLFARWSWIHPELLVGVWSRPAFTCLYSLPAQLGYPAAKLLTVVLSGLCAWQTWRLAVDLRLPRAPLAVPLLFLQPSYLLLSSETMTEPLFALILATALRLQVAGRTLAGMLAASTLILARPEGIPVIVLWGAWALVDDSEPRWTRRVLFLPALAAGAVVWWIAAFAITGDPLFIPKSWPRDWATVGSPYGSGKPWSYLIRLPEVVGPVLLVPFFVGAFAARGRARALVALTAAIFLLHAALWWIGGFGSAGYPRYMTTVAPAAAVIGLIGWNEIADRFQSWRAGWKTAGASAVLGFSAVFSVLYVDGWPTSRDAWAMERFPADLSCERLVWSHPYVAIKADVDPWTQPSWGSREENLRAISSLPSRTLVVWDDITGPTWMHLSRADFAAAGFTSIRSQEFILTRYLGRDGWIGVDGPRRQQLHLLYRP